MDELLDETLAALEELLAQLEGIFYGGDPALEKALKNARRVVGKGRGE